VAELPHLGLPNEGCSIMKATKKLLVALVTAYDLSAFADTKITTVSRGEEPPQCLWNISIPRTLFLSGKPNPVVR
jgi:hypothetical protein